MSTSAPSCLIAGAAIFGLGNIAQAQSVITRFAVASGGGPATSATHSLTATIGQPCAGLATSATHRVAVGFWIGGSLPPCYANCDASTFAPILNVNDFTCFLNRYAAADPYANCDASTAAPILNVNDFSCFLNKYAGGCT